MVELDVSNLSSGGPSLVSKDPSDVSSVLSILVLSDEFRSGDLDVLPSFDSLEATSGGSPGLE